MHGVMQNCLLYQYVSLSTERRQNMAGTRFDQYLCRRQKGLRPASVAGRDDPQRRISDSGLALML
jgi:hypothetical protein